MKFSKGTWDQ